MDKLAKELANIDWEKSLEDDEIKQHAVAIQARIEKLNQEENSELNIAEAARIKLVVVGDGAVGKTCLLISYAKKKFPQEYVPTVFENFTAPIKRGSDTILLHLWDTAGQEEYDRLRPLSYPGADVVLLCFSLVNSTSFEAISEKWSPEVNHYIPDVPKLLVGTKVDLRDSKTADPHTTDYQPVSTEEGKNLADEIGAIRYVEVSAKTRKGLKEVFDAAVGCVLEAKGLTDSAGGSSDSNGSSSARKKNDGKKKEKESGRKCVLF